MTTELTIGNDIFEGTESDDTILGLNGNDILNGLQGDDSLNGNQDNDRLLGNEGNDTLRGGKGEDIVQGGIGSDRVLGDLGDDTLWGDEGDDVVFGGLGNDVLYGNQGRDSLNGNEGDDSIYGGKDSDTLFGDSGDDFLSGDLGNDLLFSEEGTDTMSGGFGNDIFVFEEKFAANTLEDSDVIQDFTNGRDKIGLTDDLTFGELTFSDGTREFLGDTIIQEQNTGRYLAVLKNVDSSTLDETDFTTNLVPVGSTEPEEEEVSIDPTSVEDTLRFQISEYRLSEGADSSLNIIVERVGPARGLATVDYATVDGTARGGSDFNVTGGNLIFNPGEFTKSFDVSIREDLIREPEERFSVELRNVFGSAAIGTPNTANIFVTDNDELPEVQFTNANYTVNETDGIANITVSVNGVSDSPFTVDYGTTVTETEEGFSATEAEDFQQVAGTLSFIPGQTSQSFAVPIISDNIDDPNETIALFLVNPSNAAVIGALSDATLTIL